MFGKYNLLKPEQAKLFGIEANGKSIMMRPENFRIGATGSSGVKGMIKKISFWGSFYEVEVLVDEVKIVVRVMGNEWEVGEEIAVEINN